MKAYYYFVALIAAGIICSCEREAEISEIASPQPENGIEVFIHATMAQEGDTKTILQEDGAVYWQPGDQIMVYFNTLGVPFTSYNSVDAASALFVGNMDVTMGHNENSSGSLAGDYVYWGVYPAYIGGLCYDGSPYDGLYTIEEFLNKNMEFSLVHNEDYMSTKYAYQSFVSISSGNEIYSYSFPWQCGVENSMSRFSNIALAKSDDYHELNFYNVLGGIRFSVQSSDITRVTFRGNRNEFLAGAFSMTMDENGKPVVKEVSHPENVITLSLPNDEPFTPGVWYYMMMFPTTLAEGYTLELYTANSLARKVVTTSREIKRSTIGSLANVDQGLSFDTEVVYPTKVEVDGDYYITVGQTVQFTARVTPENSTFPLKWISTRPDIATVDQNGVVTAIRKSDFSSHYSNDYCYIVCYSDIVEGSVSVRVLAKDECISISILTPDGVDLYDLYMGDQVQLTAVPTPAGCMGTVVWSSSDENVAMVDQNGLVTLVGLGNVVITAKIGDTSTEINLYSRVDPSEAELWQFIRLNEMYPGGSDDEKYIELYNICDSPVNLRGFYLKKDESDSPSWVGIAGEVIPAHGFFAIVGAKGTTDRGFDSGFSTKKSILWELYAPDKTRVDLFQRGDKDETGSWGVKLPEVSGASWSRIPDGTGEWMITSVTTLGEANSTEGTVDTDIKYY